MNMDLSRIPGSLALGASLSGGVVSKVYEAALLLPGAADPLGVVVKHTPPMSGDVQPPFDAHADRALLAAAPETHHLDARVLSLLQGDPHVKVPTLRYYDREGRLTVMDDFRLEGYSLMQDVLVAGRLPAVSARSVGDALGILQLCLRKDDFAALQPVENAEEQALERLEELFPLLRDDLALYNEIKAKFLRATGLIHVDGHPKNIGVDAGGNVMLIDFGRMIRANEQYPAPNFAAHIALATLGGLMSPQEGSEYIREFAKAYGTHVPIDEVWFVRFFLAELVHRGLAMRWIDRRMVGKVPPNEYKLAIYALFLDAIRSVDKIDELLVLIRQYAHFMGKGEKLTCLP